MDLIKIIFSEDDVRAIAEENDIPFETAMERAQSWASAISDTATQLAGEQLESVICTDQP